MVPETIHQYKILGLLGQGGMSVVYLAEDAKNNSKVAIKLLHPFLAEKEKYRERFIREAKATQKLNHPNILKLLDLGTYKPQQNSPENLFFVTEYIDGETLQEFALRTDIFDCPEIAASILLPLCAALSHAHKKGIIHRDLKPDNIMVSKSGEIKLMDFGLAKMVNQAAMTMTGTILGSPAHMSPEVVEGQAGDKHSDEYAMGTILYWLCTGTLPFNSENPHALLKAIYEARFTKPQVSSPKISDGLAKVIETAMARDPKNRHGSMKALQKSLSESLPAQFSLLSLQEMLADTKRINQVKSKFLTTLLIEAKERIQKGDTLGATARLNRLFEESSMADDALRLFQSIQGGKRPAPPRRKMVAAALVLATSGGLLGIFFFYNTLMYNPPLLPNPTRSFAAKSAPPPIPSLSLVKKSPVTVPYIPVEVLVSPYATLEVDGKLIGSSKRHFKFTISPGQHTFKLSHRYAQSVEKTLLITKGSQPTFQFQMAKSKPAALTVFANVNGDISVGGIYKGTIFESQRRPLVVSIPDKKHQEELELVVTQNGYLPYVVQKKFVAGSTSTIVLDLKPKT